MRILPPICFGSCVWCVPHIPQLKHGRAVVPTGAFQTFRSDSSVLAQYSFRRVLSLLPTLTTHRPGDPCLHFALEEPDWSPQLIEDSAVSNPCFWPCQTRFFDFWRAVATRLIRMAAGSLDRGAEEIFPTRPLTLMGGPTDDSITARRSSSLHPRSSPGCRPGVCFRRRSRRERGP